MFSLKMEADYWTSFKVDLINYLKTEVPRDKLNKDFNDLMDKMDQIQSIINKMNSSFIELEKKYMLLFSIKDFRNLFQDQNFKEEMLNYIKYKGEIKES